MILIILGRGRIDHHYSVMGMLWNGKVRYCLRIFFHATKFVTNIVVWLQEAPKRTLYSLLTPKLMLIIHKVQKVLNFILTISNWWRAIWNVQMNFANLHTFSCKCVLHSLVGIFFQWHQKKKHFTIAFTGEGTWQDSIQYCIPLNTINCS